MIYNLITRNSIEQQIAAGLLIKQNLFEGVLDNSSTTDYVDFSSKGRSQFISQLESFINKMEEEPEADIIAFDESVEIIQSEDTGEEYVEDFTDDLTLTDYRDEDADGLHADADEISEGQKGAPGGGASRAEELEQVMSSGMQFLAGLFKMSTGKDLGLEKQQITIDRETGEVTMKFKLPI